jgi:hypothetical protein
MNRETGWIEYDRTEYSRSELPPILRVFVWPRRSLWLGRVVFWVGGGLLLTLFALYASLAVSGLFWGLWVISIVELFGRLALLAWILLAWIKARPREG